MRKLGWLVVVVGLCGCGFNSNGDRGPDIALQIDHVFAHGRSLSFEVSHLGDYTYRQFKPFLEHNGRLSFQELGDLLRQVSPSATKPLASATVQNCDLETNPDAYMVLAGSISGCVLRSQVTDPEAKAVLDHLIELYDREATESGIP